MDEFKGNDRRKFVRIKKNYILSYYAKDNPSRKFDVTQLQNISRGGMCFLSTANYSLSTELAVELKTPYLADVVYFEGVVLGCREKVVNMIYEVRLEFKGISPIAGDVLDKLEKLLEKGRAT